MIQENYDEHEGEFEESGQWTRHWMIPVIVGAIIIPVIIFWSVVVARQRNGNPPKDTPLPAITYPPAE